MKHRLTAVIVGGFILFLLLQSIPIQATGPDKTLVGVSEGDVFTYVLDEYINLDNEDYTVAYNTTLGKYLEISKGMEYNVTIINTTIDSSSFGDNIGARYSNETFKADTRIHFGIIFSILFTDWGFYEVNITGLLDQLIIDNEVVAYNLTNGFDEFIIETEYVPGLIFDYTYFVFDKTTGMVLYHQIIDYEGSELRYLASIRQKGYELPQETTTTSSSNTSSVSNTSSTSTTSTTTTNSGTSSTSDSEIESSSGSPFVAGFGFILSFNALLVVISLVRYKKH